MSVALHDLFPLALIGIAAALSIGSGGASRLDQMIVGAATLP